MSTLKFNPQIFTVTTNSGSNTCTWDLLTLDGETPLDTVYFMHNDDAPSHNQQNEIVAAVENQDWSIGTIDIEDVLKYNIDLSIFEYQDAYSEIVGTIKTLINVRENYILDQDDVNEVLNE